ncbi:MAG: ABC-type multidrug protein lipid transport system ATPase component [Paenibacillaceae bacterium]|nr:ABC-type multidrug protein lipid transport system ATPase component [Paenibacillaceae bacterium]
MRELRPFWPYVKQEAKLYLLGFIGSLFRFLIPLTAPLMIKYIFDQLLPNTALSPAEKTGEVLAIAAGLTAIFLLLRAPMEYVRQYAMHKANNNIIQALRKAIFAKIHALDAKYFTDNKSGQIGARFFDDVEKARGFMTAVFANVGIELIVLGFVVTVMAVLNIELALLSVLLVGCQFAVAHLLAKRFKTSTSAMIGYRSVLSGFIFEKIQGAFLAKLFTADARDRQQLDGHLQTYEGLTDKHAKINALMLSSVNVLSDLTPVLVVLAGSLFVRTAEGLDPVRPGDVRL